MQKPKQKLKEAAELIGHLAQISAGNTELRQVCSEKMRRKEALQKDAEIERAEELIDDSAV